MAVAAVPAPTLIPAAAVCAVLPAATTSTKTVVTGASAVVARAGPPAASAVAAAVAPMAVSAVATAAGPASAAPDTGPNAPFGGGVAGNGGGGGLGAGGDVFVQQGGGLIIQGGTLTGGTATGGAGSTTGGSAGGSFGGGIFVQGSNTLILEATPGQTISIADAIADENGSTSGYATDKANVTVEGGGTVQLTGTNTYSGTTTIGTNTTLEVGASGAGTSTISFQSATGELEIDGSTMPSNTIANFGVGDVIDLVNLAPADSSGAVDANGNLTISTTSGTEVLHLAVGATTPGIAVTSDGNGGSDITVLSPGTTNFTASTELDIDAALSVIDAGGADAKTNTAYTLTLTGTTLDLTSDLDAINLLSGSSLTIIGNGVTIDGGYQAGVSGSGTRGFFIYAGSVVFQNLTIENAVARGGAGGNGLDAGGGGGGAGLGGGLFIANGATATLAGVNFLDDQAIGGAGGNSTPDGGGAGGGGGGLGGAGGNGGGDFVAGQGGSAFGGAGGGVGSGATGASGAQGPNGPPAYTTGGAGIILGAASGGVAPGRQGTNANGGSSGGGGGAAYYGAGGGVGGGNAQAFPSGGEFRWGWWIRWRWRGWPGGWFWRRRRRRGARRLRWWQFRPVWRHQLQ